MIYTFYTGLNINEPIYEAAKDQIEQHDVFKDLLMTAGEEFQYSGIKYKIISTSDHSTITPEANRGVNILCEVV